MDTPIIFNAEEFRLLSNAAWLLEKRKIQAKITALLTELQKNLASECNQRLSSKSLKNINPPKISHGENYKGLPYHVLDFPAIFERNDILAIRTMFYWGNFFSATVHLQGKFLEQNRKILKANYDILKQAACYICVNSTPWEYEFTPNNYEKLSGHHKNKINTDNFIKLSLRIPLENYNQLTNEAIDFYSLLLGRLHWEH